MGAVLEWVLGVIGRRPGARPHRTEPRLRDRPHVAIAIAPDGERVRIVGTISRATRSLEAPISGRACVLWEVSVDRAERRPKKPAIWRPIHRSQDVASFELSDSSGTAEIETTSLAGWTIRDAVSGARGRSVAERARICALLERLTLGDTTGAPLRIREGVFELGEEIAVDGRARWIEREVVDRLDYRAPSRERRLVIAADADDPVVASDDPEGPY